MCLYTRLIPNPRYKPNKKNGGKIPAVIDDRLLTVPINCGKCIECTKKKAREWQIRLQQDIRDYSQAQFVTLTLSNESYTKLYHEVHKNYKHQPEDKWSAYYIDNDIAKLAIRRFLERWRKKYKKSVRHWLITELGHKNTEHIHLHGIIYTPHWQEIRKIWGYGYVWDGYSQNGKRINYVSDRTINYMTKYVHKIDKQHKMYKSIILCTPGIGGGYTNTPAAKLNRFNFEHTRDSFVTRTGHKMALPKYWKNKIYTDEEKELLWIRELNKDHRYIGGEKIYLTQGEEEYLNLQKYHRQRNTELGYGSYKTNYKRAIYEKETRIIKQKARLINASGGVLTQDILDKRDVILQNTSSAKTASGIYQNNSLELKHLYKVTENTKHQKTNYLINNIEQRKKEFPEKFK